MVTQNTWMNADAYISTISNAFIHHINTFLEPKIRLFMAFSVYTNGRSLLSAKRSKSKDSMDCIHGIRVFSTQWVVLGHTYTMFMYMPTRNSLDFMVHVSDSPYSFKREEKIGAIFHEIYW